MKRLYRMFAVFYPHRHINVRVRQGRACIGISFLPTSTMGSWGYFRIGYVPPMHDVKVFSTVTVLPLETQELSFLRFMSAIGPRIS